MTAACPEHGGVTSDPQLSMQCPVCLLKLGLAPDATAVHGSLAPESDADVLTPGMVIASRFRVVALLGRGGMGEIYRADDLKLGHPVALKFMSAHRFSDADAKRFIYDEVRIGRQVAHPNVCRIYDIFEIGNRRFIEMEFVEGEDLASLLARIDRIPYSKALDLARGICAGLDAAHQKGIAHGDFKPANIMIDAQGQARITDFGLSRFETENRRAQLAGTIAYMAPEQLLRSEISTRSDLYALGLVLYEIFTGRRPYDAHNLEELKRSFGRAPLPPAELQRRLDPAIEQAILQCLAVEPAQRPVSAGAVLEAFPDRDPIESLIAAGETPSPELLAASESAAPLRVPHAWALLIVFMASLIAVLMLGQRLTLYSRVALPKAPAVLVDRARDIAARFALPSTQADQAWWFEPSRARNRADIEFHWRGSPVAMVAAGDRVAADDPALQHPGMVHVVVDPSGRLLRLRSVGGEYPERAAPADWNALLAEAHVDSQKLAPAATTWLPREPHDEKRAWTLGDTMVRAARLGGRITSFETVIAQPHSPAASSASSSRLPHVVYLMLLTLTLAAGAWLARQNVRRGRVDRNAAMRVAGWVFACRALFGLLAGHHPLTLEQEAEFVSSVLAASVLLAVEVWLGYVALEPLARRIAPHALITWVRIMRGRFRDAVVGRDLLIGAVAGIALRLFDHLRNFLPIAFESLSAVPSQLAVDTLGSTRMALAQVFHSQARAIFYALFGFFLLALLRVATRSALAASVMWWGAMTITWSRWESPELDVPIVAAQMMVLLFLFRRHGLVAAATAIFTHLITVHLPLTLAVSSFYFPQAAAGAAVLLLIALYGFVAALGGRAPFAFAVRSRPL